MKVFHSFRLDALNQCLWRGDQRLTITPRAFDVLRYLVEHPGRLVTQEEILDALWPKAYVNQEVVKKYILAIRKVLGDHQHEPIFIETLPRRGYQFIAPVQEDVGGASLATSAIAESRIVGRDKALARLTDFLDKAVQGQRQIIFIAGEPGIGKTALLDAFHQRAARLPDVRIARGQCVEGFGGKEPYYPMLEALGQLMRDRNGAPIVQSLAARAPTWLVQFPSLVQAAQREALQREIMGATRERMLREICEALESLTQATTLIFVFEDLQWVDASTLDLISALARRRDAARLVILGTYRPLDVVLSQSPLKALKRELQLHGLCEEIGLERLAICDVAKYVTRKFGGGLPTDLADFVHRHSGGNPLFMIAIVQDLHDKGWIAQENGTWTLTAPLEKIDPGIPRTLQQMLDIQFDQLSASEQQILRSACVAGERFSVWLISPLLDFTSDQIEDVCEGLAERQQLIKAAGIDEVTDGGFTACYEFIHALYREGIYRRLSDLARSKLHLKIAERLESQHPPAKAAQELAPELARHFEFAHDYARAIHYLLKAAERAGSRFAYRESIRILQHALELVPKVPSGAVLECQIQEFIGDAYFVLGAMAESAKSYQTGAHHASRAGLKAAQVSALCSLVRPLGLIDPDRGIAAIDQAAQVSDGLDDPLLVARTRMLGAAIRLLYDTWRSEDAELCTTAYETLRRLGEDESPSYHKMIYAHVLVLEGDYEEAIAMFDHDASRLAGPASLIAHFFALSGKTVALLRSGRFGEVLQIVRDGKEMAAKDGNDPWLFNFREAWLHVLMLDFEGGRRLCEAMLCSGPEYPTGQPQAIARVSEGYVELDRSNYAGAVERFSQVVDSRSDGKFFLHWAWRMTAQLGLSDTWLAAGDLRNARNSCDLFLSSALSTSDPYFRALAWDRMARFAMFAQDWDAAQGYVDQALSVVKNFAVPMAAWQVYATAHDWNFEAKRDRAAQAHRAAAVRHILSIADSFAPDEPLRASFLAAAPVRRILTGPRSA